MTSPDWDSRSVRIIESYRAGTLINDMCDPLGDVDNLSRESFYETSVHLHNQGRIDLLSLGERLTSASLTGHRFFAAQRAFVQMIPKLKASPDEMMRFVLALVKKGGEDLASNFPNAAFAKWCEADFSRAREIVTRSKTNDELAKQFLTFALVAANMVQEAMEFIEIYAGDRRLCGVTALGRMHFDHNDEGKHAMDCIAGIVDTQVDDTLLANALAAFLNIASKLDLLADSQTSETITKICVLPGPQVVHCCAHVLFEHGRSLPQSLIGIFLNAVLSIDPSHKGTLDLLDVALSSLVKTNSAEAAINFVKKLLLLHEDLTFGSFDGFGRALLTEAPDKFRQFLVDWLLSGEHTLCSWVHNLIQKNNREMVLDISSECRDLPPQMQIFLSKKAIGYFFLEGQTAASILVSILRVCHDETAASIRELLSDVLLVNYGESIRTYLDTVDPEDAAASHVKIVVEQHERYSNDIASIGELKELHPSERHRQIERLRRYDQNRKMVKDAHNMSVFRDLIHRSSVLYGRRSMSIVRGPNNERQLFKMDLKEHSFSMEMPRMEIVDPVTLAFLLFSYRVEKLAN